MSHRVEELRKTKASSKPASVAKPATTAMTTPAPAAKPATTVVTTPAPVASPVKSVPKEDRDSDLFLLSFFLVR